MRIGIPHAALKQHKRITTISDQQNGKIPFGNKVDEYNIALGQNLCLMQHLRTSIGPQINFIISNKLLNNQFVQKKFDRPV